VPRSFVIAVIAWTLAACAPQPAVAAISSTAGVAGCVQPAGPVARPDYCSYPLDVRAFLDDRDLCDHFRSEPWPESHSAEDRARRNELVHKMKTTCAGTDRRLAALKHKYRAHAVLVKLLSEFETSIEISAQSKNPASS
jgi:hypothetical protein